MLTVQLLIAERADVNIPDGQQRKPFSVSKGGVGGDIYNAFESPLSRPCATDRRAQLRAPVCTGDLALTTRACS